MDRRFDPRSIVTPYAFAVHPDLLGMPLASPWQRFGAILVDLVVIGLLTLLVGGAPLAIASTLLLFWLAFRKQAGDAFGKFFRIAVGCLGFLILTVTVLIVLLAKFGPELERMAEEAGVDMDFNVQAAGTELEEGGAGIFDMFEAIQGAAAFRDAESREEAQTIGADVARNALGLGVPRETIRTLLEGGVREDAPWADEADSVIQAVMAGLSSPEGEAVPEGAYADALAAGLDPAVLDSIDRLNSALQQAEENRADLQDALGEVERQLTEAQESGVFGWLFNLIDDLGLGFGWGALYLTIAHTWWRGTSVGKKVFGIRVVMIDKRPLNLWLSFERAGGYAAGFATGLLGFAQVFWDPNRQAIHDKVSETIVIKDGKERVPGPWMEEGRAQWDQERHGFKPKGRG